MTSKPVNANIGYTLLGEELTSPQKTETQVSPTDTTGQIIQAGGQLLEQGGSVSLLLAMSLFFVVLGRFVREVKKD